MGSYTEPVSASSHDQISLCFSSQRLEAGVTRLENGDVMYFHFHSKHQKKSDRFRLQATVKF